MNITYLVVKTLVANPEKGKLKGHEKTGSIRFSATRHNDCNPSVSPECGPEF